MVSAIGGLQGWSSADMQDEGKWLHPLSDAAIEDFINSAQHAAATGKTGFALDVDDFPLHAAGRAALDRVIDRTQHGCGVQILRGFPVARLPVDHIRLLFWGLGLHMGVPRPQGIQSQFMSDVTDLGGTYRTAKGRGYNTRSDLDFHADNADVVGLMCVRDAKSGGETLIASSLHAHDVMMAERPDLVAVLYEPFIFSRQGEEAPEEAPYYASPIFSVRNGHFACRHVRNHIKGAQATFEDIPRLTALQTEALDYFDAVLARPEVRLEMRLQPGDMQFLNNHIVLHSRTQYEDWPEPERKRLLFRLWLAIPQAQPLDAGLLPTYKDVDVGGVRGGFRGANITPEIREFEQRIADAHQMRCRIYEDA
jgi:hypothetical protein